MKTIFVILCIALTYFAKAQTKPADSLYIVTYTEKISEPASAGFKLAFTIMNVTAVAGIYIYRVWVTND
jgi:hypothetical protein